MRHHVHRIRGWVWRYEVRQGPEHYGPPTYGSCGYLVTITATRRGAERMIRRFEERHE